MNCPSCGAENPDNADYCALCMQSLRTQEQNEAHNLAPSEASSDKHTYVAPGEWRGDAETQNPATRKTINEKLKKHRLNVVIYVSIIFALTLWLVLSLTIWGNPSPGEKSMQLIDSINAKSLEGFNKVILPDKQSAGEDLYRSVVFFLGDNGSYSDINFDIEQDDVYTTRAYIKSGDVKGMSLDRSDNLVIILENKNGVWYVNPQGTVLIP
jgi:hypothetical protein